MVLIFVDDMNHDMTEPIDTFAITENKTRTIELMVAPNMTASYQVTVDGQIIITKTVNYSE